MFNIGKIAAAAAIGALAALMGALLVTRGDTNELVLMFVIFFALAGGAGEFWRQARHSKRQ